MYGLLVYLPLCTIDLCIVLARKPRLLLKERKMDMEMMRSVEMKRTHQIHVFLIELTFFEERRKGLLDEPNTFFRSVYLGRILFA